MRASWNKTPVRDISTRITKGTTPTTGGGSFAESGIAFIKVESISEAGNILAEKLAYIDEVTNQILSRSIIQKDDVLFTIAGTIGRTALIREEHLPANTNQAVAIVRPDQQKVLPRFLYYALSDRSKTRQAESRTVQSVQANFSLGELGALEVELPSLTEQGEIASILGALDDKIELNRRMSGTLEALAQAVFKEWFVEKAEEGWQSGTLGDVATQHKAGIKPEDMTAEMAYIGLEHMPQRSIALADWSTAESLESNKFRFSQGDILFGKLRSYFHKVGVAPVDGVCSTDIVVVRPKAPEWFGFVLGHTSSKSFVDHTSSGATGTRMPRTSWQDMARYELALPPRKLAEEFTAVIQPMIQKITVNIHESRTLAALRDTLLPKLMRGEVRVKNAISI